MSSSEATAGSTSNRPKGGSFRQQSLPAWQPFLTASTVFPAFCFFGVSFIISGVGMLYFSNGVMELRYDYTMCKDGSGTFCHDRVESNNCTCIIDLPALDSDWEEPVYLYYGLTNFYQNHRRYVKSRDDSQLLGDLSMVPDSDCSPFDIDPESKKPYFPCGAIANSLFSDDITLKYRKEKSGILKDVPLLRTGIAWDSDKTYKFHNPTIPAGQTLEDVLKNFAKPRDWHKNLWELDPENPANNGLENEDLIVWMRSAALPNFRKFYRRVNHTRENVFEAGLPANFSYHLEIVYRFPVVEFSGTKSFIMTTTSILGGKGDFLGWSYVAVGIVCIVVGVVLWFLHKKYGKSSAEMMAISPSTEFH